MAKKSRRNQILFYMHAGSGNHGCEAIVNSLAHMLHEKPLVVTNRKAEDETYTLGELCKLKEERSFSRHKLMHLLYYGWRLLTGDRESFIRFRYEGIFGKPVYPLAVSIGGDNYCYENMLNDLKLSHSAFKKQGTATVLLGCSIEPELLKKEEIKRDLQEYDLIIARESITYEALKVAFGNEGDSKGRLRLIPDPAFTLRKKETSLPSGFLPGATVGINISPMIQEKEQKSGITMECYRELIRHLLEMTEMSVALIPHVVWERNDDRLPLTALYEEFRDLGKQRLILVEDRDCQQLKTIIAGCRFFIGARTHATIAAYSTCVPTLVVGYSVKAKGIARDLFGEYDNYVIPVQSLEQKEDLVTAWKWLFEQEERIGKQLEEKMPDYCEQALKAGKEVEKLWEEYSMQRKI